MCSRQFPHSRSRANKPEKESEDHKKPECKQKDKLGKKERKGESQEANRKGEERKRRKKKDEKRLGERKKKRDKVLKKERKLGLKTKKEVLIPISAPSSSEEVKTSKMESTTLNPENQSQSTTKHKHRVRRERAEGPRKPSANTAHPSCTSPQPSSKSENHKMSRKNSSPHVPVKNHLMQSPPRNTKSNQTRKKPTIVSSQPKEEGTKENPDNTLPSLLFKALAPLSTACSVSSEQSVHSKDSGQGGVLNAPDLQPVAVMGNLREIGDNLANTPPVLSWQGSPVSVLGEDEDELEKGVISRPVLQPSPTQCFSPPPADNESIDDMNKEPCESVPADYSHTDKSEFCDLPCAAEQVTEEEKEEDVEDSSGEASGCLLHKLRHHKAGLDDVFKSLATFLGGQRGSGRGGPFGGPPAITAGGVKYSSSLAEIHCHEHHDFSPKSDPTESSNPSDQLPTHTTSDILSTSHKPTYLSEPAVGTLVLEKQEDTKDDAKEHKDTETLPDSIESSLLDGSLSAELRLTTTNASSFTGLLTVSTKEEREHSKETEHRHADRKRKQKDKDGGREGEIKIKIKAEESRVICPKNKVNEINDLEGRDASSLEPVISRSSPRPLIENMKGQISQGNQTPHSKDIQREKADSGNTEVKVATEKEVVTELENKISSAARNPDTKTPNSESTITINASKLSVSTPASKPPCSVAPVDPLKLKALSMGLCKELKILLIKVESAGRQTFNISEVEEQRRIPLSKLSVENKADEVIRACK